MARIIKQSSTNLAAAWNGLLTIGPGLAGLLGYQRADLPHDVVAGLAVAAVTVPVGTPTRNSRACRPQPGCTRASCRSWSTRSSAPRGS